MTPTIKELRINAYMDTMIRHNNKVVTRKQFIKSLVDEGYINRESTTDKYKCTNHRYNNMSEREQNEFDKKQCKIPYYSCYKPTETSGFELTKIEFDYMEKLIINSLFVSRY